MKKFAWGMVLTYAVFAGVSPIQALDFFEVRLGAGGAFVDPDDLNQDLKAIHSSFEIDSVSTLHLDLLAKIPVIPFGFGARIERGGADDNATDGSNNGVEYDFEYTRYAVLANWRIINTKVFLGPIASLGFHSGEVETLFMGNTSSSSDLDGDGPSATLGVEGGLMLRKFLLGAEGGYQYMKFEGTGDSAGRDADFSGLYIRLMAGYRF